MDDQPQRVRVEEVDWTAMVPFVRLFRAFAMAMDPPKLLVALLLVVVLAVLGHALDAVGPRGVYPGEIRQFATLPTDEYDRWIARVHETQLDRLGVYGAAVRYKCDALGRTVLALTHPRAGRPADERGTVTDGLKDVLVTLPAWLWYSHRWYLAAYALAGSAAWAVLGGAVARMAALHATKEQRLGVVEAVRYASSQWVWFFLTPLMPLILAALVAVVPVAFGLLFFNVPWLGILGGLVFIVPLVFAAIITMLLVLWVIGGPLFYPAIAVEATDSFDAISRAFGYVLGRPWQWLFYSLAALAFGAISYALLAGLVYLILSVTASCVGLWVWAQAAPGLNRFDAIFPSLQMDQMSDGIQGGSLGLGDRLAAGIVSVWVNLLVMLVGAYAISFYFCASTWVYLLLRHSADGTELDEVHEDPQATDEPLAVTQTDQAAPED